MGMRDLGTLGGTDSRAFAINNAAQVAGVFGTPEAASHAFITGPNGMGMRNLGTLGGNGSYAAGINDAGQVVGRLPRLSALPMLSSPAPTEWA